MLSRSAAAHAGPSTSRSDMHAEIHGHDGTTNGPSTSSAASDQYRGAVTALAERAEKEIRKSLRKPGLFAMGGMTYESANRLTSIRGELTAFQQAGLGTAAPRFTVGQRAASAATSTAAHAARIPAALASGVVALGTGTTAAIGTPLLSMCCICESKQTDGNETTRNRHIGGLSGIARTPRYVKAAVAGEGSLPRMLFRKLDMVPTVRLHSRHARTSTHQIAQSTISALDAAVAKIEAQPAR